MKKILLVTSIVFLFSCNNSSKKEINNKEDISFGNKIIKDFYNSCNSKDFYKLNDISSSEIDSTFLKKMVLFKDSVSDKMIRFEIDNIETIHVENNINDSLYSKLEIKTIVKTFYNNGSYTENLSFIKENNNPVKIIGYHLKGNYK